LSSFPTLAFRLGEDSISRFESAAPRRLAEAIHLLEGGKTLAAIYLFGYVAEMCMKAARYRLLGFQTSDEITTGMRRMIAGEDAGLPLNNFPHDLEDEAVRLIYIRKKYAVGFGSQMRADIQYHAIKLNSQWRPALRYRSTVPLPVEISSVRESAVWFEENYPKLWS